MTYLEELQKAKTKDDFFNVLFECITDYNHCRLLGEEFYIEDWLDKEVHKMDILAKAISQFVSDTSIKKRSENKSIRKITVEAGDAKSFFYELIKRRKEIENE